MIRIRMNDVCNNYILYVILMLCNSNKLNNYMEKKEKSSTLKKIIINVHF